MPSSSAHINAPFTGHLPTDASMLTKLEKESKKARQQMHAEHEREIHLLTRTIASLKKTNKASQPTPAEGKTIPGITREEAEKRMANVVESFVQKEEELVLKKDAIDAQWKRLTDSLAASADPTYIGLAVWNKGMGSSDIGSE